MSDGSLLVTTTRLHRKVSLPMPTDRICSIPDCNNPHDAKGYCSVHYQRSRRHANPEINLMRPDLEESFWAKVQKTETCWIWVGYVHHNGYGAFKHRGRRRPASVWAWMLRHGREVPTGLEIDHLCRNTVCVNPDHLEAVMPIVNKLRSASFAAVNARKTHCIHGHEFTPENTIRREGRRRCRTCANRRRRKQA